MFKYEFSFEPHLGSTSFAKFVFIFVTLATGDKNFESSISSVTYSVGAHHLTGPLKGSPAENPAASPAFKGLFHFTGQTIWTYKIKLCWASSLTDCRGTFNISLKFLNMLVLTSD